MAGKNVSGNLDTAQLILNNSVALFARHGYEGVSMRDIAKAVDISAAALYHHYPDKQNLYIATMEYAFADSATTIHSALDNNDTPHQKLERFVKNFTTQISSDPNFRALLHRELLDGNSERLKLLAVNVFLEPFNEIKKLAQEMKLGCDPHLLAVSIAGLILFHYETEPIRRYLPGSSKKHSDVDVITQHVINLLTGTI